MATGSWTKFYTITIVLLVAVIGVSLFCPSEPKVTAYTDAVVETSLDWNTYRFDVSHLGIAPEDCTVDAGLELEWMTKRLNVGEYTASKSSPAVSGEYIYIGLDRGALVAVNRVTGLVEWSYQTHGSRHGIHSSPTVDPERGLVYVGAYDGGLYAVNLDTGKLVWESKLGDYIGASPTLYEDIVYIGVEMDDPDGFIVGVEADTGREVFRSDPLGNHPHSSPSIDPESRCIFIGANTGDLYCYWLDNQTMRWRYETGAAIKSTPMVYEGIVYITSWDRGLHAVNISKGEAKWVLSSSASSMSSPTINPAKGLIYFGNHGGVVYGVNASNGDKVWQYRTGDVILSSPTLVQATNTVIIGSKDNGVYLLDATTGELKQKLDLESGLTGVPVAVGEHLYVFDHLGYLYSFRMK